MIRYKQQHQKTLFYKLLDEYTLELKYIFETFFKQNRKINDVCEFSDFVKLAYLTS